MAPSFASRLATVQQARKTDLALRLAPNLTRLPAVIQRYDDPFLPFGKEIIKATHDLVCAYVFDLAAYLSIGAAGAVALERTIAYASGDSLTILHGPFVGTDFAVLTDEGSFNADAVTLMDKSDLPAYLAREGRFAFVSGEFFERGIGVFRQSDNLFLLQDSGRALRIRLVGDIALYASRAEDFAAQTRAVLEKMRR